MSQLIKTIILIQLLLAQSALAQDSQPTASSEPDSERTILKGGVRGAALRTEHGLTQMGQAISEIKTAASMVAAEVTRKQTTFVRGPNVLPGGVIIPALGGPSGTIPFGDLPARKKQLTRFVNSVSYNVELLQNQVDALILPQEMAAEMDSSWKSIQAMMAEIQGHLTKLKELSVGDKFDNNKIGKQALAIFDKSKTVDSLRKSILVQVQAAEKQ